MSIARRPPRSLMLVGPAPPPSGGIASHVADLAAALAGEPGRVRIARLPPGGTSAAARAGLAAQVIAAGARGDVVHLHTNGHNAGSLRLAALVGALAGPRAIVTLHSGLAPEYLARHRLGARVALAGYRRIVCVQDGIASALSTAGVAVERLVVAPAFSTRLPPRLAPPGLAALRRRHRVLLSAAIGRGPEYGAHLLLDAFARLRRDHLAFADAGLVLCGPGARDESLDRAIDLYGVRDVVHRYGDLPRGEALGLLAAADLFVRPTLADGDAVSVREALLLGRRVVASDASPRPPGVRLFATSDPVALAAACARSLAQPAPVVRSIDGVAAVLDVYRALGLRAPAPPAILDEPTVGLDDDAPEPGIAEPLLTARRAAAGSAAPVEVPAMEAH